MLTRDAGDTSITLAHQLRQIQASAGSRRVLQRRDEPVQVIANPVEGLHNRLGIRRKDLNPQRRVRSRDTHRIA